VPAWLIARRTRPRVYLTLGTVSFGAVEVLSRAVAEIAALDVDVLVTVGPEGEPASLGAVPNNVHVERFVAQSAVLPLVDLIVPMAGRCSAHSKSGCPSCCRKVRTRSSMPRS
jgi:UDP:flavonoid glycosyltransferase YjiC (YdhE family)